MSHGRLSEEGTLPSSPSQAKEKPPVGGTGGSGYSSLGPSSARATLVTERQCEQLFGEPVSSAVRKLEPQPQAATAFGLLTVKPAPMSVST